MGHKQTWAATANWHVLVRRGSSAEISPEQSWVRRYAPGVGAYVDEFAASEAIFLINRYGRVYTYFGTNSVLANTNVFVAARIGDYKKIAGRLHASRHSCP
jgi:hypothetical protein